jgi:hypothetical protein
MVLLLLCCFYCVVLVVDDVHVPFAVYSTLSIAGRREECLRALCCCSWMDGCSWMEIFQRNFARTGATVVYLVLVQYVHNVLLGASPVAKCQMPRGSRPNTYYHTTSTVPGTVPGTVPVVIYWLHQ